MKRRTMLACVFVGATLLFATGPVSAHHSMVGQFNLSQPVTVRGTLTKMEWANPHGSIYVDVKSPNGQVENWKFETGPPIRMEKQGLKKTDFRVGSEVIVSGFAARDASRSAAGLTITFPEREASFPDREASFLLGR